jgi:hypothetical protein
MAIREELTLGIQNFQANLDRARSDVRKTAGEMSRDMRNVGGGPGGGMLGGMGGGIASLGRGALGALGMTAGVAGLGAAVKGALTQMDDLADLSLKLNESAEGLQRVDFAAQQAASVGVDQVAKSMMRLERSLGDVENARASEALERLGLTGAKLTAMPLEEKILALSAAFQKARLEGTGMADIQDLLGRTAADLVPLFEQSGDALRDMFDRAPVVADAMVQEMARVNDEFDALILKAKTLFVDSVGTITLIPKVVENSDLGGMDWLGALTGVGLYDFVEKLEAGKEVTDAALGEETENAEIAREEARKTQAENMEKAANAAKEQAVIEDQGKQLENFEKAEAEANKDAERRRLAAAEQRAREAEAYEKSAFSRLDPEAQMETLRDRIAESLGVDTVGSTAEIEAGAEALAKLGKFAAATSVLSDLGSLEAIAGRQGGTRAQTSAGQGSLATLMDEIFGRTPAELQLEEARRAAEAGEKTAASLDQILKKMDEPADASVFSDGSFGY